ncbi:MAG: hypothetical protein HQL73_12045 [Magnetococcales bacterium]|nr:hypothetical protein [Magnetococcales bacterium]
MQENLENRNTEKGTHGGCRPGAGRPMFEATDEERKQVEAMASYGVPQEQIASMVRGGIGIHTLRNNFELELIQGKARANCDIGRTLFQQAIGGNITACIFWLKTQAGWREPPKQVEVSTGTAERFLADVAAMEATMTGGDPW